VDWANWLSSLVPDEHPIFDTADCSFRQPAGNVWFLGGTFKVTTDVDDDSVFIGTAERDCSVPYGKALFFPVLNTGCNELEDNTTGVGLIECTGGVEDITFVEVIVDGTPVSNIWDYRYISEPNIYPLGPFPVNNIYNDTSYGGITTNGVQQGYYMMLKPLPVGHHTLSIRGAVVIPDRFSFFLNVSYDLDIQVRNAPPSPCMQ
jgi:hypothetical protein